MIDCKGGPRLLPVVTLFKTFDPGRVMFLMGEVIRMQIWQMPPEKAESRVYFFVGKDNLKLYTVHV